MLIEIHPGTGGEDAEEFAAELTSAIMKHPESRIVNSLTRVTQIEVPECL